MALWITFKKPVDFPGYNRPLFGICVEGTVGETMVINQVGPNNVDSIKSLPYPADPRLGTNEDSCPSFCFRPNECAGYHSCPRPYACSE